MKKNLKVIEFKDREVYFLYIERQTDLNENKPRWHDHPFYEIMFLTEGEIEYVIQNKRYLLKPGDVFLARPFAHHFEHKSSLTHSALYCLGFFADTIKNAELLDKIFIKTERIHAGCDSLFADLLSSLKRRISTNRSYADKFIKNIAEAAIYSLDEYAEKDIKSSEPQNETVKRIIDYITQNLSDIQTVEDIANPLFFSISYLRASFKREMGIGIMQYVRNKKAARAHEKIRQGGKPTEIYRACGFTTYSSFYRAYVSYFGFPPKIKK